MFKDFRLTADKGQTNSRLLSSRFNVIAETSLEASYVKSNTPLEVNSYLPRI